MNLLYHSGPYEYDEELMEEYYSRTTQPIIKDEDYEYEDFPVALEGIDYQRLLFQMEKEEIEEMTKEWRKG